MLRTCSVLPAVRRQGCSLFTCSPPLLSRTSLLLSNNKSRYSQLATRSRQQINNNALITTSRGGIDKYALQNNMIANRRHQGPMMLNSIQHHLAHHHLGAVSYFSSGIPGGGGGNRFFRYAGVVGTGAVVLFGKGKYLLGALKLTKLASLGSMILSIGAYSMVFGLPYAVGVVGLITVHEVGHVLVMMQRGIPFSPMVFLPFMGAAVGMKRPPKNAWEDAMVAFGGPVLGTLGTVGVAAGAQIADSQLLFALADFGYMVNLFNLMPLGSMDGGRIMGALSKYTGLVGLGVGGAMAYNGMIYNPIFYLILLSGGWETFQRFYNPHEKPPYFYKMTSMQRTAITGGYFGLIAFILAATSMNQRRQKPPEVLMRQQTEKSWEMM